jgi:hypothetical protein
MERHAMTPVRPPQFLSDIFTDDENARLFNVLRTRGPWRLIAGIYFKSAAELQAVSGNPANVGELDLSDYLTPAFRGFFGNNGTVYEESVHDIFYSRKLLDLVKGLHGAQFGAPYLFQFNIQGPSPGYDGGHFDGRSWRGMDPTNTPAWLMSVMAKSGLFDAWEVKAGQVISYYYDCDIDGGFTYWPDGPDRAPARFAPPFWNSGLLTDNQRMFHRGEACGPRDRRSVPAGMALDALLAAEGESGWKVTVSDRDVAHYAAEDMRILFHYSAHVFADMADLKRYHDHSDDLTPDRAFEMMIGDLRQRGEVIETPSDPMNDATFVAALTRGYAMTPRHFPPEAPLEKRQRSHENKLDHAPA